MKIVLLTSDYHISANIGVKTFLNNPHLKKYKIDIVGIVSTSPYDISSTSWQKMRNFMKRSGWSFSLKSILSTMWKKISIKFAKYFIPNKTREHFDIDELAKQHKVPFIEVHNINSDKSKEFIKKMKPDYLVSCFLLQIVKREILDIPFKDSINVHPSLIQEHRGTFTSFWTLLKKWKKSGATVHFMTEKPDRGRIILQRHFFVHPSDTIYCINKKSAKLGANLLVKALVRLKKNEKMGIFFKKFGQMFTAPTLQDVKMFHSQGKGLIKARDFFKV